MVREPRSILVSGFCNFTFWIDTSRPLGNKYYLRLAFSMADKGQSIRGCVLSNQASKGEPIFRGLCPGAVDRGRRRAESQLTWIGGGCVFLELFNYLCKKLILRFYEQKKYFTGYFLYDEREETRIFRFY